MKKTITIAAVAMAVCSVLLAFISCKKENDWICTCRFTDDDGKTQSFPQYLLHINRKVAKSACKESEKTFKDLYGNGKCSLK